MRSETALPVLIQAIEKPWEWKASRRRHRGFPLSLRRRQSRGSCMSRNDRRTVSNGGYSLVEMLVVVSIIGILLGIAAVFGHDALVQSQVEDQTREMFTDLMNARVS